MNDPDLVLAELFAAGEAPAEDAAFVLQVIERVERRRLWLELGRLVLGAAAGGALLWALAPVLEVLLPPLRRIAVDPAMTGLVGAAVLAAWLWAWVSGRGGLAQA